MTSGNPGRATVDHILDERRSGAVYGGGDLDLRIMPNAGGRYVRPRSPARFGFSVVRFLLQAALSSLLPACS